MRSRRHFRSTILLASFAGAARLFSAAPVDYSREIQPILSENCYHCHGPDLKSRKAELRLDTKEGALVKNADGFAPIVAGKPDESELIKRIFNADPDEVMPPPDSNRTLTAAQKALLKRWIAEGAVWGEHWAFVAPVRPAVPAVADRETARREDGESSSSPRLSVSPSPHPIDAFVRARLAKENLAPSPEASREELIRRVTLDLTGLPPTPAEVDAFVADRSADAYQKVVDRLLASPRYGERWAWDWLDLARYADTNGFQGDPERTMWPWRDWVVNALNANQPYDQFTVEQLAGDLLPGATREQKLASGFHRNNMFNGEGGRIAEETRVENVFDRVETTATVWLGATFTCARCHDHKFDPIKQKDYYALYDIFNQMSETGSASAGGGRSGAILPVLDISTPAEQERVRKATARVEEVAKEISEFELKKFPRPEGKPASDSPEAQKLPGNLPVTLAKTAPNRRGVDALLEAIPHFKETDPDPPYAALLDRLLVAVRARDAASSAVTKVMIMDELPAEKRRTTFILDRGNYEKKTDVQVLGAIPSRFASTAKVADGEEKSERINRLDLARWLVSPQNPLAARVTVN
ncbi:MAG TPA: DUF1549 domain-containing protein, partial [Opitutaceae bacterium]|nr:DUF1549 domain-containing protein [Opitutaceae bacterium]